MPERLHGDNIPQANDVAKVFRVVELATRGTSITPRLLSVVPRQVDYYKHAARVLGFLDEDGTPTSVGRRLASSDESIRLALFRTQFERSACGAAWVRWSRGRSLADVEPESAEQFVTTTSDLDATTAERRAQTLRVWLGAIQSGRIEAPTTPAAVRSRAGRDGGLDDAPWSEDAAKGAVRLQVGMVFNAEGERKLVTHFQLERDPEVRRRFLNARRSEGRLNCDACAVDLGAVYGRIFQEVVEVHHRTPLAHGVRTTSVEDLALLCPTCHRVAHYRQEEPRSVEEVARLVNRARSGG
jgi:hypothetical protein